VSFVGFEVPEWVAPLLDRLFVRETFFDRAGLSRYLSRWYVLGDPDDGKHGRTPHPFSFFVHCIHRSDDDQALHNHPWTWSVSFIVSGGYLEERRARAVYPDAAPRVVTRRVRPFTFNVIRGNDFHRVDLVGRESWSFFLAGPKLQPWGFWDRATGDFWPKDEFIRRVREGLFRDRTSAFLESERVRR
jgi:hypothetical protein